MDKDRPSTHKQVRPAEAAAGVPAARSSSSEIAAFLSSARSIAGSADGDGRLIFALDATMSRQPTWDVACHLQGEMFDTVGKTGGLNVQLVYFRGFNECRSSKWVADTGRLARLMSAIDCRGGQTQIGRVLRHANAEARGARVNALVYIGDAMEENIDELCALAGELSLRNVPCFMFHEGHDPAAETAFREIARLTNGAYAKFDRSAAAELAALLRAVATFARGGRKALEHAGGSAARLLLGQMKPGSGGNR
ncbi:hypothetical protein DFR52_101342 [Hoeflea marina]|uniref:VWA domain-containing protein n=1 Tax=Hoeflea marina TaxID=274592 RepID=A0A317PTV7_9HYPH|nr:hypothetical protein [Hoeflea marina]PWW03656.1 hypothetical protein DFR52_101342 [Hoeflea marina]